MFTGLCGTSYNICHLFNIIDRAIIPVLHPFRVDFAKITHADAPSWKYSLILQPIRDCSSYYHLCTFIDFVASELRHHCRTSGRHVAGAGTDTVAKSG